MSTERRRHERYDNEQLVLNVARPGIKGILRLNPTAACLNFSLAGLQFGTEQAFEIGERLILDLCVDDIELTELMIEVRSCKLEESNMYCCGVSFCFDNKRMQKPEIRHCLLKIEDRLRTYTEYGTP